MHYSRTKGKSSPEKFARDQDFSIDNPYGSSHSVIPNMPPTRNRTRLQGKDAQWRGDDEEEGVHCYRPEVHVQEWSAVIQRFTKPGDWILDSTAGSASIVPACLRLNRRVFTIECDKNTELFEKSRDRAHQAYAFFKKEFMLKQLKAEPVTLRAWEYNQMSWIDMLLQEKKVMRVLGQGWGVLTLTYLCGCVVG